MTAAVHLDALHLVLAAAAVLIAGAGWDIPRYQSTDAWILPIPAVFIVDEKGIIRARHVDPDYRRRMELDDILIAARLAGGQLG